MVPHIDLFFFQAEDGIRDKLVTGVQTCALPILSLSRPAIQSSSVPRLPIPMCPSEMRSFAPTVRLYERAVLPKAVAPAAITALRFRNARRLIFFPATVSSLMINSPGEVDFQL